MASEPIIGVYLIRNIRNDKIYIGSSANVKRRWNCHISGRGSKLVAQAILKYGSHCIECYILEICSRISMPLAEAYWIALLSPEYNLDPL